MTEGEKRLWKELRRFRADYGIHVRRQAPIGPYIADFAVHSYRLVMEVDGEHHFTPAGERRDAVRDEWFARAGYRVLRITTGELSDDLDGCVATIMRELGVS